jgi:hypothetical protein
VSMPNSRDVVMGLSNVVWLAAGDRDGCIRLHTHR